MQCQTWHRWWVHGSGENATTKACSQQQDLPCVTSSAPAVQGIVGETYNRMLAGAAMDDPDSKYYLPDDYVFHGMGAVEDYVVDSYFAESKFSVFGKVRSQARTSCCKCAYWCQTSRQLEHFIALCPSSLLTFSTLMASMLSAPAAQRQQHLCRLLMSNSLVHALSNAYRLSLILLVMICHKSGSTMTRDQLVLRSCCMLRV